MLIVACGGEVASTAPEPAAGAHFMGTWLIDQPYHGAYEAAVYDLSGDGSLALKEDVGD